MTSLASPGLLAPLPNAFVIRIEGADSARVINNLCTNDILKLEIGSACESFITDLRGWVVAHGAVLKKPNLILLLGSHPSPEKICGHIDRYIVREDARVEDITGDHRLWVLAGPNAKSILAALSDGKCSGDALAFRFVVQDGELFGCRLPVIHSESFLLCAQEAQAAELQAWLTSAGIATCESREFERLRIANFWPLMPNDIREKTIPQELDRDARAISFTKGCYLGQETIARLDARGQLQKKLCLAEVLGEPKVAPDAVVLDQVKEVGTITSAAFDPQQQRWLCLALMRRGYFDPGIDLTCTDRTFRVLSSA